MNKFSKKYVSVFLNSIKNYLKQINNYRIKNYFRQVQIMKIIKCQRQQLISLLNYLAFYIKN